jgi:hypothetical protein
VRLALALQAEIERKQAALITSPDSLRQQLASDPRQQLQQDIEFAWYRQRAGEGSVRDELQRLSRFFDELHGIVISHTSGGS